MQNQHLLYTTFVLLTSFREKSLSLPESSGFDLAAIARIGVAAAGT